MRKLLISVGMMTVMLGLFAAPSTAAPISSDKPAAGPLATVVVPAKRVPPSGRYIPPHTRGDREYDGNGPNFFARASLLGVGTSQLRVQFYVRAEETKPDNTTAEGTSVPAHLIYQAPAGQCVRSVNKGDTEELQYTDTDTTVDTFGTQVFGSFVNDWSAVGDTAGDDAGIDTGVHIHTEQLTVTTGAC